MKKTICFLLGIFVFSLLGCVSVEGDELNKSISTSKCDYEITTTDKELKNDEDLSEISINVTFKKKVTIFSNTSTWREETAIDMIAVNDENETIELFSNRFGEPTNDQMYSFTYENGDTLEVFYTFSSINPTDAMDIDNAISGTYSVKIKLHSDDKWIDTELNIIVI